jgi:ribonuclease PH
MRNDGRTPTELRPVKITRGFTQTPAGSVLWEQGKTVVLCTASISRELPPWMKDDRPGGWVTAEYVMLPASTPQRKPWPKIGHTDSRGTEIQRLIGRSLRAVVDTARIGPHTIALDCQVLQADGGTRTAAICGAYVALVDAIAKLPADLPPTPGRWANASGSSTSGPLPPRYDPQFYDPRHALADQLGAVSIGVVDGEIRLDLDYSDDSRAEVDLNVAYTAAGKFVEVQGSAENGGGFDRPRLNQMLDLAVQGCERLMSIQREALERSL